VTEPLAATLARSWPRRASVRRDRYSWEHAAAYDPARPDYPVRLLPFGAHPAFAAATPEQQAEVLALAWRVYNERVVTAEERVATPAMSMLMTGTFPGCEATPMRLAVQQSIIDEHFHTYFHMLAIDAAAQRATKPRPELPSSVTYRRYLATVDGMAEQWERDLVTLVWTIVSEVSINAYLELLSKDETIQPEHREIVALHAHDEYCHGSLMVEVAQSVYHAMGDRQRALFCRLLPVALNAFLAHDDAAWRVILAAAGIADGDRVLRESADAGADGLLTRDFSGLRDIVDALDIRDRVDFEFA
jgi:hypothetical protein